MLTFLSFFFSSFPFSISIWTAFVFILSCCGYYAVSPALVSSATRLAYSCDIYMYLDTYVRWSHLYIFVWWTRFVSVVCNISCFYLFSSWGNFPLQSYWSLSCDHGLHFNDVLKTTMTSQNGPYVLLRSFAGTGTRLGGRAGEGMLRRKNGCVEQTDRACCCLYLARLLCPLILRRSSVISGPVNKTQVCL